MVTENTAALEGGAIYADGKMGLENVTVTGNTSGGEGFAIYLTSSEFDGHSYQTGHKRIAGEMVVKDNQGGDLYLINGNMTKLEDAGIFAADSNNGKEENPDEEVLELEKQEDQRPGRRRGI